MSLEETSGSEVFYLDRPSSICQIGPGKVGMPLGHPCLFLLWHLFFYRPTSLL